jgi:hypothetical protein
VYPILVLSKSSVHSFRIKPFSGLTILVHSPKTVKFFLGRVNSADEGRIWQNGTYSSGSVMKVNGLPARQMVTFRLRSIGTLQRKSGWSEEMELFLI